MTLTRRRVSPNVLSIKLECRGSDSSSQAKVAGASGFRLVPGIGKRPLCEQSERMYALFDIAHTTHTTHTGSGFGGSVVIILLLIAFGMLLGRWWGRRAALKHLGEWEFRQRWANVRRIRRF
jgi:hypothetical protein